MTSAREPWLPAPQEPEQMDSRERKLHFLLARVLARPRWLSIGSHENTAELRISRDLYEDAMATLRREDATGEKAPEPEAVGWADIRPGDTISLVVFSTQFGREREQREVVAVDWPQITLSEDGREYVVDATEPETFDRQLRLVSRAADSHAVTRP